MVARLRLQENLGLHRNDREPFPGGGITAVDTFLLYTFLYSQKCSIIAMYCNLKTSKNK